MEHLNSRQKLFEYIKVKKSAYGSELCQLLKISRQALNKQLKDLIDGGKIVKEGATRAAKYYYATYKKIPVGSYRKKVLLKNLAEDVVFKEADLFLKLKNKLRDNVFNILYYAFTEIVNNAIEHSRSAQCLIELVFYPNKCEFKIRDYGIGIFNSILSKSNNLRSEADAIGELMKGKKTTMPKRHTGEGIFFTSRAADSISFRSHKLALIFDNIRHDVFVEEAKFISGSEVKFSISNNSRRVLEKIFNLYAPREFGYKFQKTRVLIRFYHERYVSRSEAKRVLSGLDKFREIIFDFKGVKSIGQGFADEIFRVFKLNHPGIAIKIENINPSLGTIIKHVVDNKI